MVARTHRHAHYHHGPTGRGVTRMHG